MARLEGAVPGSEENLQGNGGWGCIDWSRLQHTAAWGDPEGHRVLVWLLLACTKGKGAHSRAGSSRSRPRKFSPPSLVCSHRDHLGWGPGHLCRDSQVVPALGSQAAGTGYKGPFLGLLARLHRGHDIPISTVQELRQPLRFIRYTSRTRPSFTKQVPKSTQLVESCSSGTATVARRGTTCGDRAFKLMGIGQPCTLLLGSEPGSQGHVGPADPE